MLYLIGGEMKSGKSYIARKMMEEKKIPFFSTDFLLWSIGDYEKKDTFSYFDTDEVVSKYLESYIMKIVSFIIRDDDDFVMEGTHITPSLVKMIEREYPGRSRAVMLGYAGVDENRKYDEIIGSNERSSDAWYTVLEKEEFKKILRSKAKDSESLKKICEKEGIRYYNIEDINTDMDSVIEYLTSRDVA